MSLPVGYRQVEYLESTGTQYIDIGRKMYNNSELELCFSFDEMQQDCSIFGSRRSSTTNNFEIASTNNFPIYLDFGSYNTSRATYNNPVINTKYICTISKSLRAVYDENRTLLARNTNLISAYNVTPSNARIFDTVGGYSKNKLKGKVYYCKIWEDGVLVRNMIPCLDNNSVPCMYDRVSGNTYYNDGTGQFSFAYLPETGNLAAIFDKNALPLGYTQLQYIESSGTQYIDTGYYATNTSGINIDYAYTASGNAGLCGIYQGQTPRTDTLFITTHSGQTSGVMNLISQGNSITNDIAPTIGTKYNGKINYLNDGKLILNYTTTGNNGSNGVVSTRTIKLFCRDNGETLAYTNARIYMCQISEGTNLVRNLIPCLDNNGVPAMYDTINDVTYRNAGTGSFTYGQVIPNQLKLKVAFVKDPLPTGYIRLDYIENPDQNAYINTGIVPDDTMGFKVRMSVKNTTADLYYLGCRESNQTDSRFGLGVYQGHTYMALGTYYSNATAWTITSDTPFVAENNYKNSRVATMNGLNPVSVGTLSGITLTRNIYLFKSNQQTTQITSNCRIYECEITQGSLIVARFVPCLDNNGVACMYDTVRHQTFYSAGSSNFITDYVPPVVIPSGYTQLKYIGSDGSGQYVNTNYIATQTTNIECDFMITQHNSNLLNYVYGEYLANRACGLYISSTSNVYGILYGTVDRNTSIPRVFNEKVHSILNSSYFSINETTENVGYSGTYTAPYNLFLFKGNGPTRPGMIGRIYYMLIREARGVVSRYLIPCLNDQNEVGFYDVVTEQFYTNGGTGTLTYQEGVYEDLPTNNNPVEIELFSFN